MEKDIILAALIRLQEIVNNGNAPSHGVIYTSLKSDRRLARLALKKYHKAQQWRQGVKGCHDGERQAWT